MRSDTCILVFACVASAQNAPSPAGKWISNLKFFEENRYQRLELTLNGTKLNGKLGDDAFEGAFRDGQIEGVVKTDHQISRLLSPFSEP
jgi:hypothetical protein